MTKQTTSNNPRLPRRVRNHVNPLADRSEIAFEGFNNNKPIIVDIGAYRGEFSQGLLEHFGDSRNLIVTEIRKPYVEYLKAFFEDAPQVAVFGGDSARTIRGLLESSISRGVVVEYIFVNFPDPWFKEKHKKRRVVNPDFLTTLSRLVGEETTLVFQTDQRTLFEETVELIEDQGVWEIEYFDEPLWGIQSYWEQVKIGEGDTIYRMKVSLQKTAGASL